MMEGYFSTEFLLQQVKIFVSRQISDLSNIHLHPHQMGPTPVYTIDDPLQQNNAVPLRASLYQYFESKQFEKWKAREHFQHNKREHEKKYKKYPLVEKKEIVEEVHTHIKESKQKMSTSFFIKQVAKRRGVPQKNITRWFEAENLDQKQSGRKPMFPQLQKKLLNFMKVTPKVKRKTVLDLAKKLLREEECKNFSFSKGWFERFKKRHKVGKLSEFEKMKRLREDKICD